MTEAKSVEKHSMLYAQLFLSLRHLLPGLADVCRMSSCIAANSDRACADMPTMVFPCPCLDKWEVIQQCTNSSPWLRN